MHENKAYAQAKSNYDDLKARGKDAVGSDALAFMDSFLTTEEIEESDLQAALIGELIKTRQEQGISQKRLEEISGVKQPVIARLERGASSPQLSTLLKILVPMGKTLAIVDLEK